MNAERRPERRPGAATETFGGVESKVQRAADAAAELVRARLVRDLRRTADRSDDAGAELLTTLAEELARPAPTTCCGIGFEEIAACRKYGLICGPGRCARDELARIEVAR